MTLNDLNSKQDGSGVVEEDKMKSIDNPYFTQSNYYYLYLLALFTKIQKSKKQTPNILANSMWIWHLLILLGNGCLEKVIKLIAPLPGI